MKKNINRTCFVLAFLFCCFYTRSQKNSILNFRVSCNVTGSNGKKILLGNKPGSGTSESFMVRYFDSCYSVNDSFQFTFDINEPAWYSIEIDGKKGWRSFVAEPGIALTIDGNSDSLYKSRISGSSEDSIFTAMTQGMLFPLTEAMYKSRADSFKTIYPKMIRDAKYNFIRQNPNSFVVAKYLVEASSYNRITDTAQLHYLQKCYLALSSKAKKLTSSKNAYYNLFVAPEKLTARHKIPQFVVENYEGTTFDLYKYLEKEKKKYWLIDFWATWCRPCIAQLPKLRQLYLEFKNKGFGIIGYSLDINKDKLEDFLAKQSLEWKNVSDLKGDQSLVYKLFKLGTIPANFLVDEKGIIIAMNVTADDISKILSSGREENISNK